MIKITQADLMRRKVMDGISGITSYRIVKALLEGGELSVKDVADKIGAQHSATSHQLSMLMALEIVSSQKQSRHMIYRIADTAEGRATRQHMAV